MGTLRSFTKFRNTHMMLSKRSKATLATLSLLFAMTLGMEELLEIPVPSKVRPWEGWKVGALIEVYSNSKNTWCPGVIYGGTPNKKYTVDSVTVMYKIPTGEIQEKTIRRKIARKFIRLRRENWEDLKMSLVHDADLPPGWTVDIDRKTGFKYYTDPNTGIFTYKKPVEKTPRMLKVKGRVLKGQKDLDEIWQQENDIVSVPPSPSSVQKNTKPATRGNPC